MSFKYTWMSICIWCFFFLYIKKKKNPKHDNYIKNKLRWNAQKSVGMLNPNCRLHDFTLQSLQDITGYQWSGGWFIRSAGSYGESWRKEGRRRTGGQETGQKLGWRRGYDMVLQFSRRVTPEWKSDIWRKEVNSWLTTRPAALCLARFYHHNLPSTNSSQASHTKKGKEKKKKPHTSAIFVQFILTTTWKQQNKESSIHSNGGYKCEQRCC